MITEILSRERLGALLVTDENGRLTGIVSERDIIEASAAHGPDVFKMPASALMTKSLITCVGEVALHATGMALGDNKIALRMEVRNSGVGLTDDQIARLFKPFSQADSATTRHFGGTGLGLSISKQLAELLGGEIAVESTPGKGSTFWFTAIVEQSNQENVSTDKYDEQQQPTASRKPAADLLILVAEDNHINQKVVRRLLDPLDCRVDMVENGLDAIAAVTRTPYDLVLMDVQMPKMDGPTATAKIRSLPDPVGAIPVIALTANAMHGDRKPYLAMGMTDYISKPIDHLALYSAISRCTNAAMLEIKEPAFPGMPDNDSKIAPLSPEAAAALDDLIGELDDLLEGNG